jgi:PAS domain-containing protein
MTLPHFNFEKDTGVIYYVVAIVAALFAGLKVLWKYIVKLFRGISARYRRWESAIEKIEVISKEFQPNHGSSLKDQLNRISSELSKNTELTEKIATRQKWIFDSEEIAIFESDNEGNCVWVNTAYLKLADRDMGFILGHGWKNVIAPEDRDRVIHNWELCVKDGRDSEDTYHIVDSKGNKVRVFTAACKTGKFGYVGAIKVIGEDE